MTRITRLLTMFVFVFALLISMGSFVNTATAKDMKDVLYLENEETQRDNFESYGANGVTFGNKLILDKEHFSLKLDETYKITGKNAKLKLTFDAIGEPAKDDPAKEKVKVGIFDKSDSFGFWDFFLSGDTKSFSTATTYGGFYIQLYKVKDESKNKKLETLIIDDVDEVTGEHIPAPRGISSQYLPIFEVSNEKDIKLARSGNKTNIGLYLWGINPIQTFFGKTSGFGPISIPLINLEKNTRYVARIFIDENVVAGATAIQEEAISYPVEFTTSNIDPTTETDANLFNGESNQTNTTDEEKLAGVDISCSIVEGDNFWDCLAIGYYNLGIFVTGSILHFVGLMFDKFLFISISSGMYDTEKANFVYLGWKIVRDLANIFFIFILLYTSIGTILGIHGIDYKKVVVKVIVIGLLINFSLMFTRVVIDAGNILSRVFYNQITIKGTGTDIKEKSISQGILNGINIQKVVISPKTIEDGEMSVARVYLIATIMIIFHLAVAWVLFMCAAFFLGRIGSLWFAIIFAPLAFVSHILPSLDHGLKQLGWSNWLKGLMDAAFKAPIFMFMMYIIITLTQSGFIESLLGGATAKTNGTIETIVIVLIPLMIILGLLMKAKDMAKDMAGEFGGVMDGLVKAGVGVGAMALTGGVAAIGAKTFGAGANNLANNEKKMNELKDRASKGGFDGWKAMKQLQLIDATKKGSFDLRQTGVGNALSKATGVNMDMGSAIPGMKRFSTANTAGGFDGMANREAENLQKKAEFLKTKPTTKDKEELEEREDLLADAQRERIKINTQIQKNKASNPAIDNTELAKKRHALDQYIDITKDGGTLDKESFDVLKKNPAFSSLLEKNERDANDKLVRDANGNVKKIAQSSIKYTAPKFDGHGNEMVGETKDKSLAKQKAAVEASDKKYIREFYKTKMEHAGAELHGIKRDVLGNLSDIGHADFSDVKGSLREAGWSMARNLSRGFTAGMIVAGPMGAAIGTAGFGLASAITSYTSEAIGKASYEATHIASDPTHKPHPTKSSYKSPNAGFFDIFVNVGKSDGGGHSDAHAGGHGDAHDKGGGHH